LDPFQLEDAVLDIDAIWLYLLEKEGAETAAIAAPISRAGTFFLQDFLLPRHL
jgi:hypothetical protein